MSRIIKLLGRPLINPQKFNGNILWLDSSDASSITESGGLVSEVSDKSTGGNNAVQATGSAQPTIGSSFLNNKNVIGFDGSNDALSVASSSSIDDIFLGGATVLLVMKSVASNQRIWDKTTSSSGGHLALTTGLSGGNFGIGFEQGASTTTAKFVSTSANIPAAASIIAFTYNSSNLTTAPEVRVNGDAHAMSTSQTGVGTAVTDASKHLFIANRSDFARPLQSGFAELIIYNRVLPLAEITIIENYLSNKWGVSI